MAKSKKGRVTIRRILPFLFHSSLFDKTLIILEAKLADYAEIYSEHQ
jgi:hypothetical protein